MKRFAFGLLLGVAVTMLLGFNFKNQVSESYQTGATIHKICAYPGQNRIQVQGAESGKVRVTVDVRAVDTNGDATPDEVQCTAQGEAAGSNPADCSAVPVATFNTRMTSADTLANQILQAAGVAQ